MIDRIRYSTEYSRLQTASLAYISIPTIIFVLGWIRPIFSIPLTCLILVGLWHSRAAGRNFTPAVKEPRPDQSGPQTRDRSIAEDLSSLLPVLNQPPVFYALTLILVVFAVLYSGVGGFSVQDGDYVKHNGFFLDLTKYSWPLAYAETGADRAPRVLNTYLAYYLPSAVIGKILGFDQAYFFSFVWVCLGLFLTLIWISQFVSKRSILFLLLFIFFGELAYFGWAQYFPHESQFGKSYNYANWMLFHSSRSPVLNGVFWILGSNHTFLANGPHHIFPSWICILMIFHDAVFRKSVDRIGYLFAFVPFVSAFLAIGLAPFVVLAALQNRFKNAATVQNFLVAPLLIVVAGLFLMSNNAQFTKGWLWEFVSLKAVWPYLIRFLLLGCGFYFLLMPKKATNFHDGAMRAWLYTSLGCIVVFSFYKIGRYMDFPIKAYNPSWIIFQVCVLASISYSRTRAEKIRSAGLISLLLVGSIGALSNLEYARANRLFTHRVTESNSLHVNRIGPLDQSGALFSDGTSFFWETLGKKPTFTKN